MFSCKNSTEVQQSEKSVSIIRVKSVKKYATFKEAIESVGIQNVLPGVESIEDAVGIYHKIKFYNSQTYEAQETAHGAIVVDFELIKKIDVNPGESKKDLFQKNIPKPELGEMKINDCATRERVFFSLTVLCK